MNLIAYTTTRLQIQPLSQSLNDNQLTDIKTLLSPSVVEHLPPYFHNINSLGQVTTWLNKMHSESQLLGIFQQGVSHAISQEKLIGFIFLSNTAHKEAHLGYLLAQDQWGKGYAKECLQGLIDFYNVHKFITCLHAGVDGNNLASIKLLGSLGFTATQSSQGSLWYRYDFTD